MTTTREFRDQHYKSMSDEAAYAGEYLEHSGGLIFGHHFVVADAIELAAAFMCRKLAEDYRDEQDAKGSMRPWLLQPSRFQEEDWEERYG